MKIKEGDEVRSELDNRLYSNKSRKGYGNLEVKRCETSGDCDRN